MCCPICLDDSICLEMIKTECNHSFCKDCYTNLVTRLPEGVRSMVCALCRQDTMLNVEIFLKAKNLQLRHLAQEERSHRLIMVAVLHDGRNLRYTQENEQNVTLGIAAMLQDKNYIKYIVSTELKEALLRIFCSPLHETYVNIESPESDLIFLNITSDLTKVEKTAMIYKIEEMFMRVCLSIVTTKYMILLKYINN